MVLYRVQTTWVMYNDPYKLVLQYNFMFLYLVNHRSNFAFQCFKNQLKDDITIYSNRAITLIHNFYCYVGYAYNHIIICVALNLAFLSY